MESNSINENKPEGKPDKKEDEIKNDETNKNQIKINIHIIKIKK